jgi:hypothetical protein
MMPVNPYTSAPLPMMSPMQAPYQKDEQFRPLWDSPESPQSPWIKAEQRQRGRNEGYSEDTRHT